jgi:hypothetical protein
VTTDAGERGLERVICRAPTGSPATRRKAWLADEVFAATYSEPAATGSTS